MRFALALAALATVALAPAANAGDTPRLTDCVQLSKQVSAALEAAQPGTSTDAARQQASAGRAFCASQMYAQGVVHYTKALQLLGKS